MNFENDETLGGGRIWNGGDRINPTYEDGEIYMIRCCESSRIYVGSTIYGLERIHQHQNKPSKTTANIILEKNNYEIKLLEKYPCEDKYALAEREHHYISILRGAGLEVVNAYHPPIHPDKRAEYYKEYHKKYHQQHYECSYGMIMRDLFETEEEKKEKQEKERQDNIAYLTTYRANQSEEDKEKWKQYYHERYERIKTTEKYKEQKQKWMEENKEEMKEYQRNWVQTKRQNDEEFRQKEAQQALERYNSNKETINARRREKIQCPECQQELARSSMSAHKKKFHPNV